MQRSYDARVSYIRNAANLGGTELITINVGHSSHRREICLITIGTSDHKKLLYDLLSSP